MASGVFVFVFSCLALIKRYTELTLRLDRNLPDPSHRNYRKDDLVILATLAAATGTNAVTVFAFYVTSPAVADLYSHPKLLWLICPLLLYLLGRALMVSHRREMHDDPVVWALRDRICRLGLIVGAMSCWRQSESGKTTAPLAENGCWSGKATSASATPEPSTAPAQALLAAAVVLATICPGLQVGRPTASI